MPTAGALLIFSGSEVKDSVTNGLIQPKKSNALLILMMKIRTAVKGSFREYSR